MLRFFAFLCGWLLACLPASAAGIMLGAFAGANGKDTYSSFTALESQIGHSLAIDAIYMPFEFNSFGHMSRLKQDIAAGRTLMISWGDLLPGGTTCATAADIVAGRYDSEVKTLAQALKSLGGRILLRFRWEMEASRSQMSCFYGGKTDPKSTGAAYVAAWDHLRAIFIGVSATNIEWVWCPTSLSYLNNQWQYYFPGSFNLEWIGEDIYNNGLPVSIGDSTRFTEFYSATSGYGKPLIICETGASTDAAQVAWWQSMETILPSYPALRAVAAWDASAGYNYIFGTQGVAAFGALAADPNFQGN